MTEHILVVDDDQLVLSGMSEVLEGEGYHVYRASSGEEALSLASRHPVDLVLCDVVMEGMNGLSVLRHLQQSWPQLSVLMITGHGTINNALEALRSGAADYLQKPAAPQEVLHRIRTVLEARRLRHTLNAERQKTEARKKEIHEQLIRTERMTSLGLLAEGIADELRKTLEPLSALALADGLPTLQAGQAVRLALAFVEDLRAVSMSSSESLRNLPVRKLFEDFNASEEYGRIRALWPGVDLGIQQAPNLPAIQGDVGRLVLVIANLIINACESSGPSGRVRVTASAATLDRAVGRYGSGPPGEYLILQVEDHGNALHPGDLERIFEPFYIRRVIGRRMLSGLGLTLVHRVIEDHHGFIDVTTPVTGGNIFHVYIPAATAGSVSAPAQPGDYTGTETVLVVDDYQEQRDRAAEILHSLGYRVLSAANGREAVETVKQLSARGEDIQLAVIDLILGDDFDGVATYKELLAMKPDQKAVIVSGFADLAMIVEARKLGIRQVIQKPYDLDSLGKAVRTELDS